jgi:hypothetical protein
MIIGQAVVYDAGIDETAQRHNENDQGNPSQIVKVHVTPPMMNKYIIILASSYILLLLCQNASHFGPLSQSPKG